MKNESKSGFQAGNTHGRDKTPIPCPALVAMGGWCNLIAEIQLLTNHKFGIGTISGTIGCSEYTARSIMEYESIAPARERDQKYQITKLTYNEHIPRDQVTHSLDGYRTSNGPLKKMHHNRANYYYSDGKTILLLLLVNHKTGKTFECYYTIERGEDETALKAMNVIQTALDADEDIKVLQLDKVLHDVIGGLEKLGITPVTYPKTVKNPYSSRVESVFGNPSKQYYLNNGRGYGHYSPKVRKYRDMLRAANKFIDLDSDEAVILFSAYVNIYAGRGTEKLHTFEKHIAEKRLAPAIPIST